MTAAPSLGGLEVRTKTDRHSKTKTTPPKEPLENNAWEIASAIY
jgi:hypothetical protein